MQKKFLQGDKEGMRDDLALIDQSDEEQKQVTQSKHSLLKKIKIPFNLQVECTSNKFVDNKELRLEIKNMQYIAKSHPNDLKDKFLHIYFPED